jgi:hypothetical protein
VYHQRGGSPIPIIICRRHLGRALNLGVLHSSRDSLSLSLSLLPFYILSVPTRGRFTSVKCGLSQCLSLKLFPILPGLSNSDDGHIALHRAQERLLPFRLIPEAVERSAHVRYQKVGCAPWVGRSDVCSECSLTPSSPFVTFTLALGRGFCLPRAVF